MQRSATQQGYLWGCNAVHEPPRGYHCSCKSSWEQFCLTTLMPHPPGHGEAPTPLWLPAALNHPKNWHTI